MSTDIDLKTTQVLKVDTLRKTGEQVALVSLTASNLDAIMEMQDIAFAALTPAQQSYLLRKERSFFEQHLAEGNIVLGVVHNGKLVAQSIVRNPTKQNPKTGMVDMQLDVDVEKITLIQGVIVHPDYRGNDLHQIMIGVWIDLAKKQGRTHAIGEVAVDNHYSWANALKTGRQIHSIGVDPDDGTQVYNMHAKLSAIEKHRLKKEFNKKSAKNTVRCPRTDLEAQKKLLADGYRGISFDPASDTIEFRPPPAGRKPPPPKKFLP